MKLTQEQIKLLENGRLEENRFYITWRPERKEYLAFNDILNTIWLVWNRWKKAHIAEWHTNSQLKEAIIDICETGEVETLKETIKKFQFYETPVEVVRELIDLAEIKETDNILEPSAWLWAISENIPRYWKLTMIELDINKYNKLKENTIFKDDEIINKDFLEYDWKFNKIIANPPFRNNQDVKHILHMYDLLEKWWRLVSVAGAGIQHKDTQRHKKLKELNPEYIELPEWSFKESWTMVGSVIVLINK